MGANPGDMFGTGSMNQDVVNSTQGETQKLVDAAKSGGFKISPEAIKEIQKALHKMQDRVNKLSQNSATLSQAPKLGSHDYGQTVAEHDQKGADSVNGSAGVVLQQFADVLSQADEALQRAAGVYKETEQSAADTSKTVQV